MTLDEIEAVLQLAFIQCEAALCPLSDQQKQIVQKALTDLVLREWLLQPEDEIDTLPPQSTSNPLAELTEPQRQALLQFVQESVAQNSPWKVRLLNDWLHKRDSGSVQFIRDDYGPQWLNRVQPQHIAQYLNETTPDGVKLKVGDRIEVTNALWEWVQDDGPCQREWFPCTVVSISQDSASNAGCHCTIRFNNGAEYEIQGVYQWNRYYWRWPA